MYYIVNEYIYVQMWVIFGIRWDVTEDNDIGKERVRGVGSYLGKRGAQDNMTMRRTVSEYVIGERGGGGRNQLI